MTARESLLYLYCILEADSTVIEALLQAAIRGLDTSETVFAVKAAGPLPRSVACLRNRFWSSR